MKSFEVTLKFDHPVKHPTLYWLEDNKPEEIDVLREIRNYANKNNVPLDFIENNAVFIIEPSEDDLFDAPEFFEIDFSKLNVLVHE